MKTPAPSFRKGPAFMQVWRECSALRAADGVDRLGRVEALLRQLGIAQVDAVAILVQAIQPAAVDAALVIGTRFLATFGARGFQVLGDVRRNSLVVLPLRDALIAGGK